MLSYFSAKMAAFNVLKFEIFFLKFPLKSNLWFFRALFDIVPDDTDPPILVWRDSNKKIQVDIPQVNMYCLRIHNVTKLIHFVIPFYSVSLE